MACYALALNRGTALWPLNASKRKFDFLSSKTPGSATWPNTASRQRLMKRHASGRSSQHLIVLQKLCSLVLIGPLSEELDTELTSALWSFIHCMNHIAKSMTKGQRGKVLENDDWNDAAHELRKSLRQHGRKMYVTGVIYRAEMTKKKGELRFGFRPMKANARGEWLLELWERDRLRKQNSF